MGAKFSAEAQDAQAMLRDQNGRLSVLNMGQTSQVTGCTPMPFSMNSLDVNAMNRQGKQPLQYMFFPSIGYNGQDLHLHTFYDYDCDTPANDVVSPEKTVTHNGANVKNVNHIYQSPISNSNYFEFNKDPINMPIYPKFVRKENGIDMPRFTKRSSLQRCTPMPYAVEPEQIGDITKRVGVIHSNAPMKMFTDSNCKNEYINLKDPPKKDTDAYNVNNRIRPIADDSFSVKYTNIRSYIEPSAKTNPVYYLRYDEQYPNP
jgi:hypothetical protein